MVLRIGTRGSKLALAQAEELRFVLARAHGWRDDEIEGRSKLVIVKTKGDKGQDAQPGGGGAKGLFVKELEEELIREQIDVAIHSAKDMLSTLPAGVEICAVLPREDPRDVLVCQHCEDLSSLPRGAAVGTSSPRRRAQILKIRPDLEIVPLRGNVDTRLAKLEKGHPVAAIMALAGLKRLGLRAHARYVFPTEVLLPAVGQGALAVQARTGDRAVRDLVVPLNHDPSHIALIAERAFLEVLDGSCRSAIAGLAEISAQNILTLRGEVLMPDGQDSESILVREPLGENPFRRAQEIGTAAGEALKSKAGPAYFEPGP